MSQQYGIQVPGKSRAGDGDHAPAQPPVRYLILIDNAATGARIARLFLDSREEVAEFDAAAPEMLSMTDGLSPSHSATQQAWDDALAGHSPVERAAAEVYELRL